ERGNDRRRRHLGHQPKDTYWKITAMLLKSAKFASKRALLTQYWLALRTSLTRTSVGETPLRVTECSADEYRTWVPSQAVQVPTGTRANRVSIQTCTGWPAASSL